MGIYLLSKRQVYIQSKNKNESPNDPDPLQAVARAWRSLLEDKFAHLVNQDRWVHNKGRWIFQYVYPIKGYWIAKLRVWAMVRKTTFKGQLCGYGRFSPEEQHEMGKEILQHLSTFLGNKPYLMGDQMSMIDCVLFAYLVRLVIGAPTSCAYAKFIRSEFHNLISYVDRIKAELWP